MSHLSARDCYLQCASLLSEGASRERAAAFLSEMELKEGWANAILTGVPSTAPLSSLPAADAATWWPQLVEDGRTMLSEGKSVVDVLLYYQDRYWQCYSDDPQKAAVGAQMTLECVSAVFEMHFPAPLGSEAFFAAVLTDHDALLQGPPAGASGALYPGTLPRQFFANSEGFLDMSDRLGTRTLEVLWNTTRGCDQALEGGLSHSGRLKDKRRYLMLRLPAPGFRFEAHFVAMVGADAANPARMFAMERGTSPAEAVLVEIVVDGRIRLGRAGPADSQNFIRLVRQQIGAA